MKKYFSLLLCLFCSLNVSAQYNLEKGREYYKQGRWNDANYTQALRYLQAAAKEGYGEACYLLGEMYRCGNGAEQNYPIAMRMYRRGLEYGYDQGDAEMGIMYHFGEGCSVDKRKSIELFRRSAEKNIETGLIMLGQCYYYGDGAERDYAEAFRLLHSTVNEEYLDSNDGMNSIVVAILARCYRYGLGVEKDQKKALAYYGKGDPKALLEGALFMDELGYSAFQKEERINKAIWMWKSDDPVIYYYHALWMAEKHAPNDLQLKEYDIHNDKKKEAFAQLLSSAERDYGPAQKLMGDWLKNGIFTSKNLLKAREWYAKAKANGEEVPEL